jgi:hypothetical protein
MIPMPTYGSASEAIRAADSSDRSKRAKQDLPRVQGRAFTCFDIAEDRPKLWLNDGTSIALDASSGKIEWTIREGDPASPPAQPTEESPIELHWRLGGVSMWHPASLLQARIGCRIRSIFAGETLFNIYFERGGALQFLPLWCDSEKTVLAYLEELEPIPPN